jgi:hypothetical protein
VESKTVAQVGQQHNPPTVMTTTTTSNALTSSSRAVRFGEDEAAVVATFLGLDLHGRASSSMFLSKVCLWVRMEKSVPPERSPLSSCLLYTLDGSNGLFGSFALGPQKKGFRVSVPSAVIAVSVSVGSRLPGGHIWKERTNLEYRSDISHNLIREFQRFSWPPKHTHGSLLFDVGK